MTFMEVAVTEPTPHQTTPSPQAPLAPQDERTWSVLAHVSGVVLSVVGPLVVWLVFRDRSARVDHQGKQALNFQLTLLIGYVAVWVVFGVVAMIPIIGLLAFLGGVLAFGIWVCSLVFSILGAVAASRDERYEYPFAVTFVR